MKPLISIIVPNYNHSRFLNKRLDSIFHQKFQDFEVILLDDCSTDDSVEILNKYKNHPKVSYYKINIINSGTPFKQWQNGINLAKGEYIWIAESDDYCEFEFLEIIKNYLSSDVGICYTQTIDVDEHEKTLKHRKDYTLEFSPNIWLNDFIMKGDIFVKNYLAKKNVLPNASAVIFKRNLITSDIFNDTLLNMQMCGDWLFWIKLCKNTKIAFVSEPLNYFRNHDESSRIHQTNSKKKLRLLEESLVRNYIYEHLNINLKEKESELYLNWFKLNKLKNLFNSSFYKIKIKPTQNVKLFIDFFIYKVQKKIKRN